MLVVPDEFADSDPIPNPSEVNSTCGGGAEFAVFFVVVVVVVVVTHRCDDNNNKKNKASDSRAAYITMTSDLIMVMEASPPNNSSSGMDPSEHLSRQETPSAATQVLVVNDYSHVGGGGTGPDLYDDSFQMVPINQNLHDDDDHDSCNLKRSEASRRRSLWIMVITGTIVALTAAIILIVLVTNNQGTNGSINANSSEVTNNNNNNNNNSTSETTTNTTQLPPTPSSPTLPKQNAPSSTPIAPTTTASPATAAPTTPVLIWLRSKVPVSSLVAMDDSYSYQSRALAWVEASYNETSHNPQRVVQRFALACIYYGTYQVNTPYAKFQLGGDDDNLVDFGWAVSTGWLGLNTKSDNKTNDGDDYDNECSWYGIVCNEQGWVQEINLSNNLLTGRFPYETTLLQNSLQRLILQGNQLMHNEGDVDNAWLGDFPELIELDVSETAFHYSGIPPMLSNLVNLEILDISYSLYFGDMRGDQVLTPLQQLEYLSIGGNAYSNNATLPAALGTLTKLRYFYADYCELHGDLSLWATAASSSSVTDDQIMPNMPNLTELWIDRNPNVRGNIPPELGQYSNLLSLSLSELGLTGPIPSELGLLLGLKKLWLFGNQLDGNIPPHLGNLTQLTRFKVEDNNLTGVMPPEICRNLLLPDDDGNPTKATTITPGKLIRQPRLHLEN